jgi:hypothetical protein
VVKINGSVVDLIRVDRLVGYFDLDCDPWRSGFTMDLIKTVTGSQVDCFSKSEEDWSASDHARRIKTIAASPILLNDPIELDNDCHGGKVLPVPCVLDGWHRIYAHVALKIDTIRVHYSGRIDLLNYLRGARKSRPLL